MFLNLNVNEKSLVFSDIFLKIVTCDNKDSPWITPKVKTAIRRNSRVYKKWTKKRNPVTQDKVRQVQNETNKIIKEAKQVYTNLGVKLSDSKIGHKNFWSAYKKLTNKKKNTNIPPIIENGTFISICKHKAKMR